MSWNEKTIKAISREEKVKTLKWLTALALIFILVSILFVVDQIDYTREIPIICDHSRNSVAVEGGLLLPFIPIIDNTVVGGKVINGIEVRICQDCGVVLVDIDKLKPYTLKELIDRANQTEK